MEKSLPKDEQILKKLCVFSFDLLANKLKISSQAPVFPEEFKGFSLPLFVTWTTGKNKKLRGCIGTFASFELEKSLKSFTEKAAFNDPRFDAIKQGEFNSLNCGISLLSNFQETNDIFGWTIGKHGIEINVNCNGKSYHGTFLPEVAEENNWDQKTTLKFLLIKAHCYEPLDKVINSIKMTTYESTKIFMSYDEYASIKNEI